MKALIAKRLVIERTRKGYTAAQIAHVAGCSRRTWCNYEVGQTSPGAELLARLDTLDLDIVFIVAGRRILRITQADQELLDRLAIKNGEPE